MKLGLIVDIKWTFISDLFADWQQRYDTEVFSYRKTRLPIFRQRVERWHYKRSLDRFLNRHDVVFFEWAGPTLVSATQLSVRTPIIVRLHSYELYEYAPQINWQVVNQIILVSRAMQQKFIAQYPECAEKTHVIYNGRPLDKFKPVTREFDGNLGILCNLVPIKRVYELILTLHELRAVGYQFHLHVGGERGKGGLGERYYISMQRVVQKLGLQEQVTFYGYVQQPENWFKGIDIFISNSFWEGQQVALIEAMASGCYCLAHFWDGAEEVLPSEYLYSTESDLQRKLVAYYHLTEAKKTEQRARMRCLAEERFNIQETNGKVQEVINNVANNSK
jgi:glycosyltransferase involved in cell wall biosynthesis